MRFTIWHLKNIHQNKYCAAHTMSVCEEDTELSASVKIDVFKLQLVRGNVC